MIHVRDLGRRPRLDGAEIAATIRAHRGDAVGVRPGGHVERGEVLAREGGKPVADVLKSAHAAKVDAVGSTGTV